MTTNSRILIYTPSNCRKKTVRYGIANPSQREPQLNRGKRACRPKRKSTRLRLCPREYRRCRKWTVIQRRLEVIHLVPLSERNPQQARTATFPAKFTGEADRKHRQGRTERTPLPGKVPRHGIMTTVGQCSLLRVVPQSRRWRGSPRKRFNQAYHTRAQKRRKRAALHQQCWESHTPLLGRKAANRPSTPKSLTRKCVKRLPS